MAQPHFLKIPGYMYQLTKRNFKVFMKQKAEPRREAIINNSVHWVGHATTVINLDGKIIVTDPVKGNLGFIKRMVKPSVNLKTIKADYILLTHGHMDHLNYSTLLFMNKDAVVIVPRGIKFCLSIIGFKNIVVIRHEESYKDDYLTIQCIKAKHKGNRYPGFGYKGSNSYLISGKKKKIFFAGDTAATSIYKEIEADAAIMPVGCYKPDAFLKMHCSPEQSYNMFKTMKCNIMIPVHYKTYILAQDDDAETTKVLKNLNDGSIKIIDIGQTIEI